MRLSELLGSDVFDHDGVDLGRVRDVRIVQDGPRLGYRGGPLFRVHGLIVGRGAIGERLGFGRGGIEGPWLFAKLFAGRDDRFVPWEQIHTRQGRRIELTVTKDDLGRPHPIEQEDAT